MPKTKMKYKEAKITTNQQQQEYLRLENRIYSYSIRFNKICDLEVTQKEIKNGIKRI